MGSPITAHIQGEVTQAVSTLWRPTQSLRLIGFDILWFSGSVHKRTVRPPGRSRLGHLPDRFRGQLERGQAGGGSAVACSLECRHWVALPEGSKLCPPPLRPISLLSRTPGARTNVLPWAGSWPVTAAHPGQLCNRPKAVRHLVPRRPPDSVHRQEGAHRAVRALDGRERLDALDRSSAAFHPGQLLPVVRARTARAAQPGSSLTEAQGRLRVAHFGPRPQRARGLSPTAPRSNVLAGRA